MASFEEGYKFGLGMCLASAEADLIEVEAKVEVLKQLDPDNEDVEYYGKQIPKMRRYVENLNTYALDRAHRSIRPR